MKIIAIWIGIMAAVISSEVVALESRTANRAPDSLEETTWTEAAPYSSRTLKLYSDGSYSIISATHITPAQAHHGVWFRRKNKLALIPNEENRNIEVLTLKTVADCEFLITEKIVDPPKDVFPLGVTQLDFSRTGTGCREWLEARHYGNDSEP
jgi:hypothetical protein